MAAFLTVPRGRRHEGSKNLPPTYPGKENAGAALGDVAFGRCHDLSSVFSKIKGFHSERHLNQVLKFLVSKDLTVFQGGNPILSPFEIEAFLSCEKCRCVALCALFNQMGHQRAFSIDIPDNFESFMLSNIQKLNPKSFVMLVWGLVKTGYSSRDFLQKLVQHILKRDLNTFNSYDLALALWSFTTAGLLDGELLECFEAHLLNRKLKTFSLRDLSQVAWSFATVNRRSFRLFQRILKELMIKIPKLKLSQIKDRDVSEILWAFTRLRFNAEALFRAFEPAIIAKIEKFSPRYLGTLLWSCAFQNFRSDRVLSCASYYLLNTDITGYDQQTLTNILWTYLVFFDSRYFDVTQKVRDVLAKKPSSDNPHHEVGVDKELLLKCKLILGESIKEEEVATYKKLARNKTTDLEKEILATLQTLFVGFEKGRFLEQTFHTPDMVYQRDGETVFFVEAEGPFHYIEGFDGSHTPSGATVLRNRLAVQHARVPTVSIEYFSWDECKKSPSKKRALLTSKLAKHRVIPRTN